MSGVFRTIDLPLPLPLASVSSPPHQRRGYKLAGRWGGGEGGSIVQKTPDIGLAFYSIIPLRSQCMLFCILARSLLKTLTECTKTCPFLHPAPCSIREWEVGHLLHSAFSDTVAWGGIFSPFMQIYLRFFDLSPASGCPLYSVSFSSVYRNTDHRLRKLPLTHGFSLEIHVIGTETRDQVRPTCSIFVNNRSHGQ